MADVAGSSALALIVRLTRCARAFLLMGALFGRRTIAARFDTFAIAVRHFEFERAGQRVGFCQLQLEPVARRIFGTGLFTDELLRLFVIGEIFAAQRADGDEAVTAQLVDGGEEAEALNAGDAGVECLAHTTREPRCDIAIDRIALRLHRAPFGLADRIGDLMQRIPVTVG